MEECQRSSSPQRDHVILTCYPSVVAYRDTLHQVILGEYVMYRSVGVMVT